MRNFLRRIIPAVLLAALLSGTARAQSKIATVDMDKIFQNYWKTAQAEAALKEHARELDKEYRGMADELQKADDDYQKLVAEANDQAISADERDKRKQAADDKLKLMGDSRAAIDQFERQAQATLAQQKKRVEQDLFREIQKAVSDKAEADGYDLVVNTAAEVFVVYHSGRDDLTDGILAQLNAGAPVSVPADTNLLLSPSITGNTNAVGF